MRIQAVLNDWVKHHLSANPKLKVIVGYSGGMDSHVLLHALCQCYSLNPHFEFKVFHANHQLQAASFEWGEHCKAICHSYGVPITIFPLANDIPVGESLENIARQRRYHVFSENMQPNEILITAHTKEDQAETFLLQLLRGAGPTGLTGMHASRSLGKGWLERPLLDVSKEDIEKYAKQHQLQWITDDSNRNIRFRRNFLRHEVFPLLKKVYPNLVSCIARSATHHFVERQLLNEYLEKDLQDVLEKPASGLHIPTLKQHSSLKQRALFRYWLQLQGITLPSTQKCQTILQQMLYAKQDASPHVQFGHFEVRRQGNSLIVLPIQKTKASPKALSLDWHLSSPLHLPNGAIWQAKKVKGSGILESKLTFPIQVRFRQGGERCYVAGKKHSRCLKKMLQSYRIPSWERPWLPLFFNDKTLIGVADKFVCEGWQVQLSSEAGWIFEKVN